MNSIQKLWIILIISVLATVAFAGDTGKIAGIIKDKQTGDPLIGVNVVVKGTDLGAATDADGYFFILQVPPGTYDLEASYLGYHTITIRKVSVRVDLTTRVDIQMESESIQGPVIEVQAEQALVQKDITSTRRTTSREEIAATPGMEQALDVFRLHGGTFVDPAPQSLDLGDGTQLQVRDESLKDVHIRGGRGGEVLYMVDGVPVTHPIYGGRSVIDLNVSDVQSVELLTGAFSAEYGQAQSGVINIITRSGSQRFEGGVEYKTDEFGLFGDSYSTQYTSFYLGGPEPFSSNLLPNIGLDLPGKMTFFFSGNANLTNTPYNNGRTREDLDLLGLKIRERQDNNGNLNGKLTWDISDLLELQLSYHGSWKQWSNFEWLWRDAPDHIAEYSRSNQNFNMRINHTLSKSTFYTLNFGYLGVNYSGSLNGQTPADFWRFYKGGSLYDYSSYQRLFNGTAPDSMERVIQPPQPHPLTGFFDNRSFQNIWRDDVTSTYTFRGDFTSQIHADHLVKTGLEVQYNDIRYVDIQDGGYKLSQYGEYLYQGGPAFPRPSGPYPEFGQLRWVFNAFPVIGGVYIQDKFEKETLILNAGVRFDWYMPGSTILQNEWKRQWEAATGLKADWGWFKYKVSPRFGISFPISERTVVFFSYGHFNQLPELQFFYRDPYTGGFTGNPHLDYEQTILYEFGLTHQVHHDWAVDIKSYSKDISQQVGTTRLRAALGLPVDLYDNKGYGRARGLEFSLIKRHSDFTSGKISYTVQWANGYSSSAFEDYIRSLNDFPNPIRERPLSWDIRHQIILQATATATENEHMDVFGLFKLPDNWNLTVLSRFSSGQPYTPGTYDPAERQKLENSATGPSTMTTDLKISKSFSYRDVTLSLFADVFNVFDQRNIQIAYGFNVWTGEPFRYGDRVEDTNQYYDYYPMVRLMDPRQFSTGRYIKTGLRIDW